MFAERPGLAEQFVNERSLPVIDMGNDSDVTDLHTVLALGWCGAHLGGIPVGYEGKTGRPARFCHASRKRHEGRRNAPLRLFARNRRTKQGRIRDDEYTLFPIVAGAGPVARRGVSRAVAGFAEGAGTGWSRFYPD
jgi:hypothetical protein